MVNYGKKLVYVDGTEIKPVFTTNGHYMINIFDDLQNILNVEDLEQKDVNAAGEEVFLDTVMTDDVSDEELDLEVDVDEETIEEMIFRVVDKSKISQRVLKFWEVYVDEGNLGKYLRKNYPDVEVRQFTLPQWNFEMPECQLQFRKLLAEEEPHHVMVTPECRLWSFMQNMNYRTPERKALLKDLRNLEEETHLKFYEDIYNDSKKLHFDCSLEQPAEAVSWKTDTLEKMKGYYDTMRLCWIAAALVSKPVMMIRAMCGNQHVSDLRPERSVWP